MNTGINIFVMASDNFVKITTPPPPSHFPPYISWGGHGEVLPCEKLEPHSSKCVDVTGSEKLDALQVGITVQVFSHLICT